MKKNFNLIADINSHRIEELALRERLINEIVEGLHEDLKGEIDDYYGTYSVLQRFLQKAGLYGFLEWFSPEITIREMQLRVEKRFLAGK